MNQSSPLLCFVVVAVVAGFATAARAEEWIHLDRTKIEAIFRFNGFWRRGKDANSTRDNNFEEGVLIRQSGYSLDPRIVSFSLEVQPVFSQGRFISNGLREARDGNFLNYGGVLRMFHGTPGPLSLFAQVGRTSGITDGSLGSRNEFELKTRNLTLNWKTSVFPSSLAYSVRSLRQVFRSGLTTSTSDRDEVLRTLSFRGRSSKMSALLEHAWLDDQVPGQDRDYTSNRAQLNHRFRWGKGSSLNSRFDYFDRNGFNAFERLTLNETFKIQHLTNLSSSTSYRLTSFRQDRTTIEHRGDFRITHDLKGKLTTSGHAYGAFRNSDLLSEDEYEVGANLAYHESDFFGASLSAGVGGSYRLTDRQSQAGQLSIVEESHVVTSVGIIVLDQRFIDTSTIIVTDASGGFVFAAGTDYEIIPVSDDFTEITVIPSGQIEIGSTILVSYKFESLPSLKFSTTSLQFNARLDFGWISFFHRNSWANEDLISGAGSSFLVDRRNTATGVELQWTTSMLRAKLGAEKRFVRTGSFNISTISVRQSLLLTFSPRLSTSFSASEVFSKSDRRDTNLYTADLSINWRPRRNFTIRPHVGAWSRQDEGLAVFAGQRNERFLTAGFDFRWSWRSIQAELRYNHNLRNGDIAADTSEDRVMVTIRRAS